MTWQKYTLDDFPFAPFSANGLLESLKINEKCFIRKQHKCGKAFAASKSCFIACPTQDELEPILELMSEKLTKAAIEPIIAVKERAYGQDIFCTKICGKIIESRFCVVILDDAIIARQNIPNPNVYYEYGLMTSLRKHIIPLQKEDLALAFNIQSYDTIKYNAKNIGSELDRAIRDAIRITEAKEKEDEHPSLSDKTILRRLEVAGFEGKTDKWFLTDAISDTNFKGFGHNLKNFYLYLGRVDNQADIQPYIDDLGVVLYRTEKKYRDLIQQKEEYKHKILITQAEQSLQPPSARRPVYPPGSYSARTIEEYKQQIASIDSRLSQMATFYIGFLIAPDLNSKEMIKRAEDMVGDNPRFRILLGTREEITIGEIKVQFSDYSH